MKGDPFAPAQALDYENRAETHLLSHIRRRGIRQEDVDKHVRDLMLQSMLQEIHRDACDYESAEYWQHHDAMVAIDERIQLLMPTKSGQSRLLRLRELVKTPIKAKETP